MSIKVLLVTLLFAPWCFANLNSIADELVMEDSQRNEAMQKLKSNSDAITEEIKLLQEKQSEVYEQMQSLSGTKPLALSFNTFTEVMSKPMGRCEIHSGTIPGEYNIRYEDEAIRLMLPQEIIEELGTIQIRKVKLSQRDVLEISVKSFVETIVPAGDFGATLRLNLTSLEVLQATFTGQSVNDKLFGWSSSYQSKQITCAL